MTYRIRVSLPNIKGFARVYEVAARNTLYQFHKQMLADMEFPQDQVVLFKGLDAKGTVLARYATFDLGSGSIDAVTLEAAIAQGITSFVYFYDTTNKKSVILTIEGPAAAETAKPALVEIKGPNPEEFISGGYVAFEDLPPEKQKLPDDDGYVEGDDEDEDYEEEEDGDEDFSETYDENED